MADLDALRVKPYPGAIREYGRAAHPFGCGHSWHDRWTGTRVCPACGSDYKTPPRVKLLEARRKQRERREGSRV